MDEHSAIRRVLIIGNIAHLVVFFTVIFYSIKQGGTFITAIAILVVAALIGILIFLIKYGDEL